MLTTQITLPEIDSLKVCLYFHQVYTCTPPFGIQRVEKVRWIRPDGVGSIGSDHPLTDFELLRGNTPDYILVTERTIGLAPLLSPRPTRTAPSPWSKDGGQEERGMAERPMFVSPLLHEIPVSEGV
jgi:hypothetical protein